MAPVSMPRRNEEKERIRDASDIVRVIGEHVALKARGREYVGLCPFHDDRKPSMTVVPAKQIFHCFVCQSGGDVFSFIEKYHSMEFREALEFLADRAGISLSRVERSDSGPTQDSNGTAITRADLVRANATAAAFFRAILRHPEHGKTAREIIERRGISPEMVEAFGLGAAPDRWDGLLLTLERQGAGQQAFEQAGLLKRRETNGSLYDAFRNRLMFPIQDQIGRIIAFGARRIDEADEPKYLNSLESALFDKSGSLYGLHQASRAIQQRRIAIITEGYTDTIACHQAGVTNVVATLGTALTPRHASVLRRICDTVVLLFDGDDAGQRAADRAVEVFFAEDLDVRIATLSSVTDAKDPDELLKRDGGRELLERAIQSAADLLEYRYRRIRRRLAGAGPGALSRAIEEELARLVQLGLNRIPMLRRRLIIKRIAAIAGLDEPAIWRTIPGGRGTQVLAPASPAVVDASARTLTTRELALACILCHPPLWSTLSDGQIEHLDPDLYERASMTAVAHAVFDLAAAGEWSFQDLCSRLDAPEARQAATDLLMRMQSLTEGDTARMATYLGDCLRTLMEETGHHPTTHSPADLEPGDPFGPATTPLDESAPAGIASLEAIRQRRAASGDNRRILPGTRAG